MEAVTNMIDNLKGWAAHPFAQDMGLGRWAAFTGLVIVFVIMWVLVLNDLKGEIIS